MKILNIGGTKSSALKFSPPRETVLDALNWGAKQDLEMKAEVSAECEKELLGKIDKQNSASFRRK